MGYKVESNRLTKTARLVFVATVRRKNIGPHASFGRRLLTMCGKPYHVTKGRREIAPDVRFDPPRATPEPVNRHEFDPRTAKAIARADARKAAGRWDGRGDYHPAAGWR